MSTTAARTLAHLGGSRRGGAHRGASTRRDLMLTRTTTARHRAETSRRTPVKVAALATMTVGLFAAPALTSAASADTYTVRAGDTLSSIAASHGSSWQSLWQSNRGTVSDPSRIYVGQRIEVGSGSASTSSTTSGSTVAASPSASGVLAIARSLQGVPYRYGGTSPSTGFDCSGFTSYVFARAGKTIPRTAAAQAAAAYRVSSPQPGDLVFYTPYGSVSHVAIYAGNGMVYEAPGTGSSVRYAPLWNVSRFYGRL